jgi:hypothetical protein
MADMGHFLGGAAEGLRSATDMRQADEALGLRRDTLEADTSLRTRGLDLQERQVNLAASAQKNAQARESLAIDVKVNAWMAAPGMAERAAAEGTAAATKQVAANKTLAASGVDTSPTWKTLDEKVKAEGALRDDYLKQAAPFIVQRDAKNRLDNIEKTGAGDVALVFTYMKLLDPGSTVREGEFATASNAAGVPAAVQGLYNKMLGGGVLGDDARGQIKSQATKFYQTSAQQHDKLTTQFANTAKRNKLDPDSVIVDLLPAGANVTPTGIKFKVLQ